MIKRILVLSFLFCVGFSVFAQNESLKYRVILIGDAGEMNAKQFKDLEHAAKQVIPDKTTVMFLGDNIYPTGMGLPGTADEKIGQEILKSQFEPMRKAGAAVYFVPGNHDWDKSGPKGLAKIKAQSNFLASYNDPKLKLLPADGCPDPIAINLTDKLTIIAYDSEWFLFPYNKKNTESECECNTKDEILVRMQDLMERNKDKVVILASHHPFQSYGSHGGYFTWQNHLFPLRVLNKSLWIPLPGIGSLYPILRTSLLSPEDLKHPKYKDMIKSVNGVFGNQPNAIYAAGHEHGLQLIKNKQLQIVSGSGAKSNPNKHGEYSLFNSEKQGYVVADLLENNDMRFEYYLYTDSGVQKVYTYNKPFVDVQHDDNRLIKPIKADSITVQISSNFDSVSKFHRYFFGENYRKEYAMPVKVPVLRLSELKGGLKIVKLGGGNQSHSLRLEDKDGKQWVLRSVIKYPEVLLPEQLRQTFAKDILRDNVSAQHPFSALVVPDLAKAAKVPHSNPVIGWVSPDPNLGAFASLFENTLCLFEEREPLGKSDNTPKMIRKLTEDNDHIANTELYLRAKALDVLIGDWDRHDDQWRWKAEKNGKGNTYTAVPRDRDQVFFSSDGFVQRFAQTSWLLPMMQGYDKNIRDINWFLWEGREMNSKLFSALDEKQWNKIVTDFCADMTDDVFEKALKKLPEPGYSLRHDKLLAQLKLRRETLSAQMNKYYHFFNKIVDIELSDKNESVYINDTEDKGLSVRIYKISKEGQLKNVIYQRKFDPHVTKEIRLYMRNGKDSLVLNNKKSNIKLRIISGNDPKVYQIDAAQNRVILYDKVNGAELKGEAVSSISKRLSNDTANVAYVPKELYKRSTTLLNAGYNYDDGLLLGLSYKHISPGFRKSPYGSEQNISFLHSFGNSAFKFKYRGEWLNALGKADVVVKADAHAPDNTQNFFGFSNNSVYDKQNSITYYRARFNLYQINPLLRFRNPKSTFSIGPTWQYYKFDMEDNAGRFINNSGQLHSPDSLTVTADKMYTGLNINFTNNTRDNDLLPTLGSYVDFKLTGQKGLNKYSNDFLQFTGEVAIYKNIDPNARLVLTNRFGGGFTIGKPSFYQALYLGGHGNLLGYRQYRYAGLHSFYNNLEMRLKLGDFVSYVLPGQIGLLGSYDIGRVWVDHDQSKTWHQGVSAGIYFAPASMAVFRFVMGKSNEGWYPYFSTGFRF